MEKQREFFTSNKYPTLYVEDFGKIKRAEIELAPFTVFIGDNNSGKSYLLNLIWGLQNERARRVNFFSIFLNQNIEKVQAYKDITEKLERTIDWSMLEENKKKIDFDETDTNNFMILINEILNKNKTIFIRSLFNSNNIDIKKINLLIPRNTNLEIFISIEKINFDHTTEEDSSLRNQKVCWISDNKSGLGFDINQNEIDPKYIINNIIKHILRKFFPLVPSKSASVFLPTSRTGFLLTYKELAKNSISKEYQMNNDELTDSYKGNVKFLKSTLSFLHMLLNLDSNHDTKRLNEIIEYIENEVIHGKLVMHPDTGDFLYTPQNTDKVLKMHMTSAVVTELAPLILYLKYHKLGKTMFMEEPEISLHPELQQKIARVLIKLINCCEQQVFISTHSDTIIQHINNMIKLENNPKERQGHLFSEFGYDENDMVERNKIRMYQFDIDDETQKTLIHSLASSKYGFRSPTFSDFLNVMSDQIDELLEDL